MKAEFGRYLPEILPSVLSMAALNPEMGIQGQANLGELTEVLQEISKADADKLQVNTDEIEEKDVAIQMLEVFIDEAPEVCYDHINHISQLLLSLTSYEANQKIRATSARSLPGLIKAAKKRNV